MNETIAGYGVSIPWRRIAVEEIHKVWMNTPLKAVRSKGVFERAVTNSDEDTVTLALEAASRAIEMAGLKRSEIGALFLGTQTSPYLTKPVSSILVDALGLANEIFCADVQFGGKSGTSAFLLAKACVQSGMAASAIAIGADTINLHVSPGDGLEYLASAGAGAFVIAKGDGIAEIGLNASYTSDTPDYFRLDGERYIRTGGAAMTNTGVGMLTHMRGALKALNSKLSQTPESFRYVNIQQSDGRTPFRLAKSLGFTEHQVSPCIVADYLGDCGAATPLIGLANILDTAARDEPILTLSYGEGAGSDAFILKTSHNVNKQKRENTVKALISRKLMIDYSTCMKIERKYHTHERKVSTFE